MLKLLFLLSLLVPDLRPWQNRLSDDLFLHWAIWRSYWHVSEQSEYDSKRRITVCMCEQRESAIHERMEMVDLSIFDHNVKE